MSENLAKWVKLKTQKPDEEGAKPLHPDENKALKKLQREAKAAGATLATEGKGGLNPSLVLGIMRRDEFRCKKCGKQENLSVHHKGHLENPTSKWLAKKGKSNDPNAISTICASCHDDIHEEDRDKG